MCKRISMIGKKFGKLTVIEHLGLIKNKTLYKCKCECGNYCITQGYFLRKGHTRSCGCLRKEREFTLMSKKHGLSHSRLYRIRAEMIARCYNKNKIMYKDYGARQIKVCDDWLNKENGFMNFYSWAFSNGYEDNLTIDRIDVDGNYEPSNCRWVSMEVQQNNKRNNVYFEKDGVIKNAKEWAKELGIKASSFYNRFYRNSKKAEEFTKIKGEKLCENI